MVAVVFSSVTRREHIVRAQIDKDGGPKACSGAQPRTRWATARAKFPVLFRTKVGVKQGAWAEASASCSLYAFFTCRIRGSCPRGNTPSD